MSFAETLILVAIVAVAAGVIGWATSQSQGSCRPPWRHGQ